MSIQPLAQGGKKHMWCGNDRPKDIQENQAQFFFYYEGELKIEDSVSGRNTRLLSVIPGSIYMIVLTNCTSKA